MDVYYDTPTHLKVIFNNEFPINQQILILSFFQLDSLSFQIGVKRRLLSNQTYHHNHQIVAYFVNVMQVLHLLYPTILCVAKDDQMTEKFHFDTLISYDLYDIPF